jgi:hypothetical protein
MQRTLNNIQNPFLPAEHVISIMTKRKAKEENIPIEKTNSYEELRVDYQWGRDYWNDC